MPKNLSIIWLHAIWSTKNRNKVLGKSFRFKLFKHVKEYAINNGIQLDIINGVEDHVHCLFRLKTSQSPAEVIKLIKGESSFWINKNVVLEDKFEWQVGYGIFSVDRSDVMKIRKYIYNQEEHHRGMDYGEELKNLVPNEVRD
ncbi:MAG: IS200/IS605 family transposase [Balneola sp.]|jgi:putative transposase